MRRVRALVLGLVLVPLVVPLALATNFGSAGTPGTGGTTNGVWLTPNANWYTASVTLTAAYATEVYNTLIGEYTTTDLNVYGPTAVLSCSGSSGWELCVFDENYGDNGFYGWNACAGFTNGAHPNQTCTMSWVRLNLFLPLDTNKRRTLACHENGHSVGLRHPATGENTGSCMRIDVFNENLTGHDKSHLNANY